MDVLRRFRAEVAKYSAAIDEPNLEARRCAIERHGRPGFIDGCGPGEHLVRRQREMTPEGMRLVAG
ncbi:hypothetical protein Ait01nite_011680 [Actinoplanes italicus]|uniref:Uncharacterized protein n=1 Tax=Actinoplanes italicus TaxID=113567 RepID=A0A2T0KGN7_9ACTN|nr:hypothetical protein CLV67_104130 [Actinoplanes italicus]GIE28123.1 hypothetical protein Ait01nite_011680 [Actinoplanes italicus]